MKNLLPRPLVALDLEFTSWEGSMERRWSGPGEYREVIQLGAVRIEPDLSFARHLCLLCKPRRNPVLSAYFIKLTGITQAEVDGGGMDYRVAFDRFTTLVSDDALVVANGNDFRVLEANCGWWKTDFPLDGRCRNVSDMLSRAAGRIGHINSCDLGEVFGLGIEHPAHNALGDALMVAEAISMLWRSGRIGAEDLFPS